MVKIFLYENQMNKNLNIKVCGKWILAGEYAVLRDSPALAFPLSSQFMELKLFQGIEKKLQIKSLVQNSSETQSIKELQTIF